MAAMVTTSNSSRMAYKLRDRNISSMWFWWRGNAVFGKLTCLHVSLYEMKVNLTPQYFPRIGSTLYRTIHFSFTLKTQILTRTWKPLISVQKTDHENITNKTLGAKTCNRRFIVSITFQNMLFMNVNTGNTTYSHLYSSILVFSVQGIGLQDKEKRQQCSLLSSRIGWCQLTSRSEFDCSEKMQLNKRWTVSNFFFFVFIVNIPELFSQRAYNNYKRLTKKGHAHKHVRCGSLRYSQPGVLSLQTCAFPIKIPLWFTFLYSF